MAHVSAHLAAIFADEGFPFGCVFGEMPGLVIDDIDGAVCGPDYAVGSASLVGAVMGISDIYRLLNHHPVIAVKPSRHFRAVKLAVEYVAYFRDDSGGDEFPAL